MVAERGGSRKKAPCPVASGTTSRLYSTPHWLMEAEAHLTLLPPLSRAQRRRIRDDAGDDRVSGSEPRWLADAWSILRRTLEQEQQQLSAAGLVPVGIQQPDGSTLYFYVPAAMVDQAPAAVEDGPAVAEASPSEAFVHAVCKEIDCVVVPAVNETAELADLCVIHRVLLAAQA